MKEKKLGQRDYIFEPVLSFGDNILMCYGPLLNYLVQ